MDAFRLKSVTLRSLMAFCLVTGWLLPIVNRGDAQVVLAYDLELSETYLPYHNPAKIEAPPTDKRVGINLDGCAYETIQEAVTAAPSGASIEVSAGTYTETVQISDKKLTITGDYDSLCETVIGGLTEIDGSSLSGTTLVSIDNSGVTLRELSIVNGKGAVYGGGIILAKGAQVYLDSVSVTGNDADYGGGIFLDPGTVMTVSNSTITTNTASILGGGAFVEGNLILQTGSLVQGNQAPDGGGMMVSNGSVTVDNSDIQSNLADTWTSKGGGIYAVGSSDLHIQNNALVADNEAAFGGGVYADEATVELSVAFFYDNLSFYDGGGIYLTNTAVLNGTAVRIGGEGAELGNKAYFGFGGGISAITSTINLTGTQIFANRAGERGGGIYTDNSVTNLYTVTIGGPNNNTHNVLDASGHWGAGICLTGSSAATLNASIVSSNVFSSTGLGRGGGIYIEDGSTILLENGSSVENHTAGATVDHFGAGIYADNATVTLDNSKVISNSTHWAGGGGGGIFAINGSVINIENNSEVSDNFSADAGGIYADGSTVNVDTSFFYDNGAMINGGGLYLTNDSTLAGSSVLIGGDGIAFGNDVLDGSGGGIYAITSTINLDGSQVFANSAGFSGAGIYADNTSIELNSVEVGGVMDEHPNIVTLGSFGSGMFLTGGTTAILSNTVVAGNTFTMGSSYGGGIYLEELSTLNLQNNSRVEYNLAPSSTEGYGAGLFADNATITIDDSQVLSNTAGTSGGGIGLAGGSELNLQNFAVVSDNIATSKHGGGIYSTGLNDIDIENSYVEHNQAGTDGGGIYLAGGTLDTEGWWSIRWNIASGNGGGVAVTGGGDADFSVTTWDYDSYLGGNLAEGDGGGLYTTNTDTISMTAVGGYWLNFNTNIALGSGGGAALIGGGSLDFLGHVQMTGNHAGRNGGAVFLASKSALNMTASGGDIPAIVDNWAEIGGGVYAMLGSLVDCSGGVFGTETNGNEAIDGSGGAIYLQTSQLNSINCQFLNNEATIDGGAIAATEGSLVVSGSNFSNCDPTTSTCSLFKGNIADSDENDDGNGGVVFLSDSGLILSHSILNENSAYQGGGIYQTASSDSTVTDSLFFKNASTDPFGSAIGVDQGGFHMEHVTLGDNTGGFAFQSVTTGTVSVTNSIAWGNTFGFGGTTTFTYGCNIDQDGNVGSVLNPMFVNPGAGEDYHLAWNSPAVDTCALGRPIDLDGINRPINFLYDMGAYEFLIKIFLPLILK